MAETKLNSNEFMKIKWKVGLSNRFGVAGMYYFGKRRSITWFVNSRWMESIIHGILKTDEWNSGPSKHRNLKEALGLDRFLANSDWFLEYLNAQVIILLSQLNLLRSLTNNAWGERRIESKRKTENEKTLWVWKIKCWWLEILPWSKCSHSHHFLELVYFRRH